jgi:hypothetical protein
VNIESRTLKITRTPNQPLRLEPGEAVHVGVDVHKASSRVALYSPGADSWPPGSSPPSRNSCGSGCARSGRGSPKSSPSPGRPASAWPVACGPRATRARSSPPRSGWPHSARRPRVTAWTAVGWPRSRLNGLLHPVQVPTEQEEADRQVLRLRDSSTVHFGLGVILRASVRRHRRALGGSPMLRSIRPKRARVGLQTLPNCSEKPPGHPTLAPAGSSGPRGGPARSARPRRPRPFRPARVRPGSDSRRPSGRCGNAGPGITGHLGAARDYRLPADLRKPC